MYIDGEDEKVRQTWISKYLGKNIGTRETNEMHCFGNTVIPIQFVWQVL